jgi:hypothetical protein
LKTRCVSEISTSSGLPNPGRDIVRFVIEVEKYGWVVLITIGHIAPKSGGIRIGHIEHISIVVDRGGRTPTSTIRRSGCGRSCARPMKIQDDIAIIR